MGARGDGAANGMCGPRLAAWAPLGAARAWLRWQWVGEEPEGAPGQFAGSSRPRSVFRLAVCGHKHRLCLKVAPG